MPSFYCYASACSIVLRIEMHIVVEVEMREFLFDVYTAQRSELISQIPKKLSFPSGNGLCGIVHPKNR